MPQGNPYPVFPASGPGSPASPTGYGHKVTEFNTSNPYPQVGDVPGTDKQIPAESTVGSKHAQGAGGYSNPYPIHGLQYALEKAAGGDGAVKHFQAGDIRGAADMSGEKVAEKPRVDKMSAVGAAMKARVEKQRNANRKSRMFAEAPAKRGSRAGGPAKDMARRHAGSQADVNSASTGY